MTRQRAMEITREMREAGHTWRAIADHLNEAGSRVKAETPWRVSPLFSAYDRWMKQGCQPPSPRRKPVTPIVNPSNIRVPLARSPQEILAGNPKDPAAILDLANRARYFAGEPIDQEEIRAINRMYHEGVSA